MRLVRLVVQDKHVSSVTVPGVGDSDHAPPPRSITGNNISFALKLKPGPLDPLEPLAEVDFLSGFTSGPRGTDSGPAGSIRTLQNEPGPRGMD